MQVGVIFFGNGDKKLEEISRALAKGIESNGHNVDLVDASKGVTRKLAVYQYIAFGVAGQGLLGKTLPKEFKDVIKDGGELGGKKCFVYTPNRLVGALNALQGAMQIVEKYGLFIKFSEIIKNSTLAEA